MMDTSTPRLEARLRTLSRELCTSLEAAIQSALADGGEAPEGRLRPVLLTSKLDLDKSLASRVVRAISCDDPIRALHRIPTPQGLALIARATLEAGANESAVESLEEASTAYRELLLEFSGGRTDLEATLAGWIPEQRERAERDARRSVFRGMTTLRGTRTSAVYNSLYLVPPAEELGSAPDAASTAQGGNRLDSMAVTVRQDLRRLRSGARLHVMGLRAGSPPRKEGATGDDARGPAQPQERRTLHGESVTGDPTALLLRDLCSHPIPQLELRHTGKRIEVSVDPGALDVNEFATIGMGWKTERHFPSCATDSRSFSRVSMEASGPTEALVFDLFLHKSLRWPGPPFASVFDGSSDVGSANDPAALPRPELDSAPRALDLDAHPSGLASPEIRACGAIAENACREAGYRLTDFLKYRFRIAFPTPTEHLTVWWALPKP